MEHKYGLVMNSFERNVIQIALTHLHEAHDYLIFVNHDPSEVKHYQNVMKACEEMLNSLK